MIVVSDVPAYHVFTGDPIPEHYIAACKQYQYDVVFHLPPWKEIYESDNERYETFEQAQQISNILVDYYKKFNYKPIDVPQGTIEQRFQFIQDHLNS